LITLVILGSFVSVFLIYSKIRYVWKLFILKIISIRTYVFHIKGSSHAGHENFSPRFLNRQN
jgi:hypothetical protein